MKNKKIRGVVWLFLAGSIGCAVPVTVFANAADAVIVEENVIIGGDAQEETGVPVQLPQSQLLQSQPLQSQQITAQQSDENPAKNATVSANSLLQKTISGNSFVVPQRKMGNTVPKGIRNESTEKKPKKVEETETVDSEEISRSEESDPVSLPLLLTGMICLGAGITRIIQRLLVAYGKL